MSLWWPLCESVPNSTMLRSCPSRYTRRLHTHTRTRVHLNTYATRTRTRTNVVPLYTHTRLYTHVIRTQRHMYQPLRTAPWRRQHSGLAVHSHQPHLRGQTHGGPRTLLCARIFSSPTSRSLSTKTTSQPANARLKRRWLGGGGVAAVLGLAGGWTVYQAWLYNTSAVEVWKRVLQGNKSATDEEVEQQVTVLPAPEDFQHPFSHRSSWYFFVAKCIRIFQLIYVFTPVAFALAMSHLTGDEAWRKYFLDLLIETMQEAGCAFQKFGQWLSMRPDCFEPDTIEALARLRSEVNPHDLAHTRQAFRESFGLELEEVFEEFDEVPIASGTIGQVHHATLKKDLYPEIEHRSVAVKIRHPKVLKQTWLDLDIIWSISEMSSFMTLPFRRVEWMKVMQRQIDFLWEAHYLSRFAANFHEEVREGKLQFPTVVPELLSSSVLVETWAPGQTVSHIFSKLGTNFQKVENDSVFTSEELQQKKDLAKVMFDFSVKCFLRDNLVHGDLHGGNVLYDFKSCTILDAGLTTTLDRDIRNTFFNFINAVCTNLPDEVTEYALLFQDKEAEQLLPAEQVPKMRADIKEVVENYSRADGSSPDGGEMLLGDCCGQLFLIFRKYNLILRGDVATSIVTLSVCEGLVKMLDPDFDIVKRALPYLARYRLSGGYIDEDGNYLP